MTDKTVITQEDVDLDNLIGGAENVLIPTNKDILNELENNKTKKEDPTKKVVPITVPSDDNTKKKVDEDIKLEDLTKIDPIPTKTKTPSISAILKMVEDKLLLPFEGDTKIEDYTEEDIIDLYKSNLEAKQAELEEQISTGFYQSLPEEMQAAAQYLANGGKDIKGLFRQLAIVEETRALDPKDNKDQEEISRQYLRAINFGTEEEIQDEIDSYKDSSKLEAKAKQFKPKLDEMQESLVVSRLAQQETLRKQQQVAAQAYAGNIFETLKGGEINGLKLSKKDQEALYSGLVRATYPSINGKQTNELGYLLEQHQVVKPNHALVAEALWLLRDPEGYKNQLKQLGANGQNNKIVKQLKTEQSNKISSTQDDDPDDKVNPGTRKLAKPGSTFFKK